MQYSNTLLYPQSSPCLPRRSKSSSTCAISFLRMGKQGSHTNLLLYGLPFNCVAVPEHSMIALLPITSDSSTFICKSPFLSLLRSRTATRSCHSWRFSLDSESEVSRRAFEWETYICTRKSFTITYGIWYYPVDFWINGTDEMRPVPLSSWGQEWVEMLLGEFERHILC